MNSSVSTTLKCSSVLTFSVLLIAVVLQISDVNIFDLVYEDSKKSAYGRDVTEAWTKIVSHPDQHAHFARIAVGVNGNVDVIVRGTELLMALEATSNTSETKTIDHKFITSLEDLREAFNFFHAAGAGGERATQNANLFNDCMDAVNQIENVEYYLGGNAALMAQKIAQTSSDRAILIGVPVGPVLKGLLLSKLEIPDEMLKEKDEFHLIMEYPQEERWCGHTSPVATRFITSHDISNAHMLALEAFFASLSKFQPDLVILSGMHMLESLEEAEWGPRIEDVANILTTLKEGTALHVELASMANTELISNLISKILPLVDSVGLNEQELWNWCYVANGPHCDSPTLDGRLQPAVAADIIHWALSHQPNKRSRIHFHTLEYHIMASLATSKWGNQKSAAVAGARHSSYQACNNHIDEFTADLRLPTEVLVSVEDGTVKRLDPSNPVITWQRSGVIYNLTPVLVCRKPGKTVGLGDAISSTGLLYSEYS